MADANELRDYYDNTDQSDAIERASLTTEPVEDVLVSTSIRLSKHTLDEVRALAKSAGVPATTLMREWIETRVAGGSDALVVSVADLEKLISTSARHAS
jgi:predicted DNA-binding protein